MDTLIKERPILFSGQMVRAILDGRKTQTRRPVKPQPTFLPEGEAFPETWCWEHQYARSKTSRFYCVRFESYYMGFERFKREISRFCPYGQPGDRLYVKETYYAYGRWETRYSEKKGRDEWYFIDKTLDCRLGYRYADNPPQFVNRKRISSIVGWWKRQALFMPRAASRILLEITDIMVERVRDATRSDLRAEGLVCPRHLRSDDLEYNYRHWYSDEWKRLWKSIYGPDSFEGNQFVFAVEFKRIEP